MAGALSAADFGDIPEATAERAADCILDALGAAAAARDARSTQAMHAVMSARAGPGFSSVWFRALRCDPVSAATVNAMSATSLDIDDGHRRAAGHPGAAVISAALSHSENLDVSMADAVDGNGRRIRGGGPRRIGPETGISRIDGQRPLERDRRGRGRKPD